MIKEEIVQVRLNPANRKHYESHGYTGDNGEFIDVLSTHLTKSSLSKVTRICETCGAEKIMAFKKAFPNCQKCVVTLMNNTKKQPINHCDDCNKPLTNLNSKRCKQCHSAFMVGENNPNYGNGDKMKGENNPNFGKRGKDCEWYNHNISDEERNDKRQSLESINWRKAVYLKFNYHCDSCGDYLKGGECVAHHLEGWNLNKELRHSVDNGVCLCKECHLSFHKQYGFGNNTTEQYLEFKEAYHGCN